MLGLAGFLDRYAEDSAEVAWTAATALLERAATCAREGNFGRFRYYPAGELRRLRRDVAVALALARFAVAMQEEENEAKRDLTRELYEAAEDAGRRRRRQGTLAAEQARLANAKARREGKPPR